MLSVSVKSIAAMFLLGPAMLLANAHNDENSVPERLGYVEWIVLEETGLRLKARYGRQNLIPARRQYRVL